MSSTIATWLLADRGGRLRRSAPDSVEDAEEEADNDQLRDRLPNWPAGNMCGDKPSRKEFRYLM